MFYFCGIFHGRKYAFFYTKKYKERIRMADQQKRNLADVEIELADKLRKKMKDMDKKKK
jgi:hypothetical protein